MFTCIDLFAGIGGIRIAFEAVGCKCVFSSEIDKQARKTYEANFGEKPAGDIRDIKSEEIPEHDILLAGFPCQPFSIAGVSKRNSLGRDHGFLDKTQGTLFFEVARIIRDKQPKAFLLENVKNLKTHDKGRTFAIMMNVLQNDLGYTVYHDVIDAKKVLPQHRERIYIVGFRETIPFEFPELPPIYPPLKTILEKEVDDKYTLSDRLWNTLKVHAERHRAKGNGFGYGLADVNSYSRTLLARYYKDGSDILIPQEGKNPRRLTPRECARLQGFPDDFKIVVSNTSAYKQFGNSVPIPVVKAIAENMVHALRNEEIIRMITKNSIERIIYKANEDREEYIS